MNKSLKIAIAVLAVLIALYILGYDTPMKNTVGNYSAESFSFQDYSTDKDLLAALSKMFPVGTSRQQVEAVLVHDAKTTPSKPKYLRDDKAYKQANKVSLADKDNYHILYVDRPKGGVAAWSPIREALILYRHSDNTVLGIQTEYANGIDRMGFWGYEPESDKR